MRLTLRVFFGSYLLTRVFIFAVPSYGFSEESGSASASAPISGPAQNPDRLESTGACTTAIKRSTATVITATAGYRFGAFGINRCSEYESQKSEIRIQSSECRVIRLKYV